MLTRKRHLFAVLLLVISVGIFLYVCLKDDSDGRKPVKSKIHHELEHHTRHKATSDFTDTPSSSLNYLLPHASLQERNSNQFMQVVGNALNKIQTSDGDGASDEPDNLEPGEDTEDEDRTRDIIEKAYRRSMDYCNPVDQKTRVDEGNVSKAYTLRSVHVVIRHGDRSPMYKLPNQDSPKLNCLLETTENKEFTHLVESFFRHIKTHGHRVQHNHLFGLYPHQKFCMGAQLTGRGTVQHLVHGNRLKAVYMDIHGLLSHDYKEEVVVKTTDYSRTYQSAVAFLHGILPEPGLQKLKIKITNNMYFCDEHDSGVVCTCPVTSRLKENSKKEENKMKSTVTSDLMNFVKHEVGNIYGLNSQQIPWIGGIIEVLMGYVCHDLPLPCSNKNVRMNQYIKDRNTCIKFPLIGKMWEYLDARGEILLSGHADHKYNLLLIYPLLREIAQSMQNISTQQTRTKLTLYSGHDLTVRPLAKALGIYDGRWPPYASRLVFELYSSNDNQYYIRVIYNGEDKTINLKFCEEQELRDGLCPLKNFVDFAFHEIFRTFRKQSYTDICRGK